MATASRARRRILTGADIRAARYECQPIITQSELAKELGFYVQIVPPVERDNVKLSQDEYTSWLEAVAQIAARRIADRAKASQALPAKTQEEA